MNRYTPDELREIAIKARHNDEVQAKIQKIFGELIEKCYKIACKGGFSYTREYKDESFKYSLIDYAVPQIAKLLHDWGFDVTITGNRVLQVDWEGKPTVYLNNYIPLLRGNED